MSAHRYAVYLAPPPGTALWRFGSRMLGYDAATGRTLHGFAPTGFTPDSWRDATARPRRYGFHGTLKAPFRLAAGATEAALVEALNVEAARNPAFDAGPLSVTALLQGGSGFAALTLSQPCEALGKIEKNVVERLDRFRAPLTEAEIAARRPGRLTSRQRESLGRWGYPYVGPDFTFHMTLSGNVTDAATLADNLAERHAAEVGTSHLLVDAFVLFVEPEPGAAFRIVARAPLASGS